MSPQPEDAMPGCVYYMTLVRDDDNMQFRLAEYVYLAKDPRLLPKPTESTAGENEEAQAQQLTTPMIRPVYKDVPKSSLKKRTGLDIFQIERLWKNEK